MKKNKTQVNGFRPQATTQNDLQLIKQLEKEIGIELTQVPLKRLAAQSFALDDQNHVGELFIFGGKMDSFPVTLVKFQNLKTLLIISSNCRDISSLNQLKNLKLADLRYNKITHLQAELLELGMEIKWERKGGAEGIYLGGNPLESPPVEIVKQGNKAIREYFKSIEGEKQALNEVKAFLVGDGSAGKTSLVKQLQDETFDKNESQTHGININPWQVTARKNKITVHLWDFGGQEIMHATHQFFLSKRSLYILVLDGRKDEKTEYWLNHIKTFGGDSPALRRREPLSQVSSGVK
ncbi:MAG: hypothetical protein GY950_02515 [bacterium]|nr:hypothetical protein [bacterium]